MFPGRGNISLGICVFLEGEHISLGICVSLVGEHISQGICVSRVGKHITSFSISPLASALAYHQLKGFGIEIFL